MTAPVFQRRRDRRHDPWGEESEPGPDRCPPSAIMANDRIVVLAGPANHNLKSIDLEIRATSSS